MTTPQLPTVFSDPVDHNADASDETLKALRSLGASYVLRAIASAIGDPDEGIAYQAFKLFETTAPHILHQKRDLLQRLTDPESRLAAVEELIRLLPSSAPPASIKEDRMPPTVQLRSSQPSQYPGMWIAWNNDDTEIVAVADTFPEILERVAELGLSNPTIEIAPGFHPSVAGKQFDLRPDESPSIEVDVQSTIPNAEEWLDLPNSRIGGQKPRDLIGTPREFRLRDIIRSIRAGITT